MGEKDIFFDAHVLMGQAMEREGLKMVNLISPGTGHVIDPVTFAEQMRLIAQHADKRLNHQPHTLRFVTWTLKYSRCHWLEVLGMDKDYARAEMVGRINGDTVEIDEPRNITRFALLTSLLPKEVQKVKVGSLSLPIPTGPQSRGVVLTHNDGKWMIAGDSGKVILTGKRPGLQGPIDDAFTTPFLCVRGTGKAWNSGVQAYCDLSLKRFSNEWRHYFRGDLPIKDDTAVTEDDIRTRNLILFGDPGSNSIIARALPHLPLKWSIDTMQLGGQTVAAKSHVPALITPNPLPGGENRYVVINSGHTFRESELAKLNYLLFPRWGDWALIEISPGQTADQPLTENVLRAGFFNGEWQFP